MSAAASIEAAAGWCLRMAEGPLDAEAQRELQTWLDADPAHAAQLDQAVALWSGVEDQAGTPEMIVLRGAALESARRANRLRWARDAFASPRLYAIAASLLIAVFVGVWWFGLPKVYQTGIGERQVVALADGSKLSLDADTAVRVRFTADRRELILKRGRARFSVAKNPLRPFTVTAAGKTVVAVGTEFSVERLGGQVRIILYEGKVSVLAQRPGAATAPPVQIGPGRKPADLVLKPGGELVIADAAPVAQLVPADVVRSLSWEGGQLIFKDEPLSRAVERVNRYAERKIMVADPAAAGVLVSGVFTAGDTDAFVSGVTAVFPLRAQAGGDATVIAFDRSRTNAKVSVNDLASGASNP